ncbi:MAG: lycopene cyclase domain-containing protein [Bacteroidia bacterium]|nr:lycopene cyclase domain-containing protein [Bacteroidia bacterium]
MPANLTYLFIDLGAFIVPFLFSFHPKIKFYKEWRAFLPANLIITVLFLIWDITYTKIGVWGFNDHYLIGSKLFNLPIEEVLFFICIPYASIFTYHCFKLFYPKILSFSVSTISVFLVALLLVVGIFNISKIYTSVTCITLAVVISGFSIARVKWISAFYFMYVVILLPFFIVNGILTGTGLDSPIVWYNDQENLGIRMLTIPVEDVFYGMLLLLLNTFVFESFRKKHV